MNYIYINLYKTSLKGVVRAEWGKTAQTFRKVYSLG